MGTHDDPGGVTDAGAGVPQPGGRTAGAPDRGAPRDAGLLGDPDVLRLLQRTPSRLADRLSAVLHPALVGAAVLLVAALRSSGTVLAGLGWWLLALLFVALVPLGVLGWFVHTGRVADHHVVVRAQRHRLLLVAALSALVGVVVLGRLDAPRMLWRCEVAMLIGIALNAVANTMVKASGHAGTMAGGASLVAMLWTPWTLLATVPMTLAVAWARLRAGRHSGWQVLVGGLVGVAASCSYLLLR